MAVTTAGAAATNGALYAIGDVYAIAGFADATATTISKTAI